MTDLVFFYGTLMSGFHRPGRARLDGVLVPAGRGWIHAVLFDLGIYPAAIPAVVIYNHFSRRIAAYRALVGDTSAAVLRLVSRDLGKCR